MSKVCMKNVLRLLLVFVAVVPAAGASGAGADGKKPLKVLAIGNSFSICVLKQMPAVARDLGCRLDFCSLYIGGCTFDRHVKNLDNPGADPYLVTWSYVSVPKGKEPFLGVLSRKSRGFTSNIEKMLKADEWDVVTVQQGSHKSWKVEYYEPYGTKLLSAIKKHAPGAKIYVQQTWSYTPWDRRLNKWKTDQNAMSAAVKSAYGKFAKDHGLGVIPMGEAIELYRRLLPVKYTEKSNNDDLVGTSKFKKLAQEPSWWPRGVEKETGLWWPDGDVFHLNEKGHYFQALVWTAVLFDADVAKCRYVPGFLDAGSRQVALMKKIASDLGKRRP